MNTRTVWLMPVVCMLAFGFSALEVYGEYSAALDGTTFVINVDENDAQTYTSAFPAGTTAFRKTGLGTLTLTAANGGFSGNADIEAGVVIITDRAALGANGNAFWNAGQTKVNGFRSWGAIIVHDYAQLQITLASIPEAWDYVIAKRLVMNGYGPDGESAAVILKNNSYWHNLDHVFSYLELGSDAALRIDDASRTGIEITDCKGHELTIIAPDNPVWMKGTWHLSETIIRSKCAVLEMDNAQNLGSGGGKIIFDRSSCSFKCAYRNFPWGIQVLPGSTCTLSFSGAYNATTGVNRFLGEFDLGGVLQLYGANATDSICLDGSTPESGALFGGKLRVTNGRAFVMTPDSLPNYKDSGSIEVQGSTSWLCLPIGEGKWDAESFADACNSASYNHNYAAVLAWNDDQESATCSEAITGSSIGHAGEGTFTYSGANTGTRYQNYGGTFKLTGNRYRYCRYLYAAAGTMIFEDAGTLYDGGSASDLSSWGEWYVGIPASFNTSGEPARLVLRGNSAFDSSKDSAWGSLKIGSSAAPGAIMEIRDGARMTNTFHVGYAANSRGALHQYSGSVHEIAKVQSAFVGYEAGSYGYHGIYGGSMSFTPFQSYTSGIGYKPGAVGIVEVRGGSFTYSGRNFRLGAGGWGEMHITGGTLNFYSDNSTTMPHILGYNTSETATGSDQAVLTISGNATLSCPWGDWFRLCDRTSDYTAQINLNGGKFSAERISRGSTAANRAATAHAYVTFNGGTLNPKFNQSAVFGTGDSALERVVIFAGGATIETPNAVALTSDTPLTAPTGKGIAAIALPANLENGKYIGPPEVRISGGGGAGATAHAVYDAATMSITGIEVTCPGWDYTSAPTVTIASYDRSETYTCTAMLTEGDNQVGGPLVKTGGNNLTLNGVNTYTGDTIISNGNLIVSASGALPANTTVVFAGGDLSNSGPAHHKYGVDAAAMIPKGYKEIWAGIPAGSTIEVRNLDEAALGSGKTLVAQFKGTIAGTPELTGYDVGKYRVSLVNRELKAWPARPLSIILR